MSVFDIVRQKLISQAKRVVIGYPSKDLGKATGLYYSAEYYARESVNASRSDMHKLVAKVANMVLESEELHDFVGELIEKYSTDEIIMGYENSGLKEEDNEQEKNDEKIVAAPSAKTRKVVVKKAPAKTTAKAPAKAPAKSPRKAPAKTATK